tara:strand:+ start:38 stop:214 length:177 start_codon:yes stop_codon:yes gene_type:complete
MTNYKDKIADALSDMYDIRRQAKLDGFVLSFNEADGSMFVIEDCISNVIDILEELGND